METLLEHQFSKLRKYFLKKRSGPTSMVCSPTSLSDKNLLRIILPFCFSLLLSNISCIRFTVPNCQVLSFAKISCYYDRWKQTYI
jgi:hypothetical protein